MIPALMIPLLFLSTAETPQVDGRKLPPVPGPLNPRFPDPAMAMIPRGDLQAQLRQQARGAASIPAVALPPSPCIVLDSVDTSAGWKAYRAEVPPKGTIKVRLRGDHEAWFTVRAMNKWGGLEKGMLQNHIPTGNPEASFVNPKDEVVQVFFLVDTTEMNPAGEAYRLEVGAPNPAP